MTKYRILKTISADTLLPHRPPICMFNAYLLRFRYAPITVADYPLLINFLRTDTTRRIWLEGRGFLAAIKQEESYHIGQIFEHRYGFTKTYYVLNLAGDSAVNLNLLDQDNLGAQWNTPYPVRDPLKITEREFATITGAGSDPLDDCAFKPVPSASVVVVVPDDE